jgi:hypothetical protein
MVRILLIVLGILIVLALLLVLIPRLSRFFPELLARQRLGMQLDLNAIKPTAWQPVRGLQRIDLDEDEEDEWLLFYRYDQGAIGGVIYDAQTVPRNRVDVSIPEQSPGYLVPYRLLPDYIGSKTGGYLGDDEIDWKAILLSGRPPAPAEQGREATTQPHADRLLVRGRFRNRYNRFAQFWWIDANRGYGAAYAATPGWFSLSREHPDDWAAWDQGQNIVELWAWVPQADRSDLCRRTPWVWADGTERSPRQNFLPDELRAEVDFCAGKAPDDPAFPEAQVLAYIRYGGDGRWDPSAQDRIVRFPQARVWRIAVASEVPQGDTVVATGEVDLIAPGQPQRWWWAAIMLPPTDLRETIRWRITGMAPR